MPEMPPDIRGKIEAYAADKKVWDIEPMDLARLPGVYLWHAHAFLAEALLEAHVRGCRSWGMSTRKIARLSHVSPSAVGRILRRARAKRVSLFGAAEA